VENKPNPAVISSVRGRDKAITAACGQSSSAVTRESDVTQPHRTSAGRVAASPQKEEAKAHPTTAAGARNKTQQNAAKDDCGNRVEPSSHSASDATKVRTVGSTNVVSKERTDNASKKKSYDTDHQREIHAKLDESSKKQRTRSQSPGQHQQQQVHVIRACADASLTELGSWSGNDRIETRRKPVADEAEDIHRVVNSISCPDPSSNTRRTLTSSTQNDLNVADDRSAAQVAGTTSNEVIGGRTAALELHDVLRQLQDFDGTTDCAASSASTKSDEVMQRSFHPLSLHFNDEPLIEDNFDVYVPTDWSSRLTPSQARSTSESSRAELQLEVSTIIETPETFADADETLLKLPHSAADDREAVGLSELTHLTECESFQDVTPNTSQVAKENAGSNANWLPPGSLRLWSCIYSRDGIEVGKVSSRFSPALRNDRSRCSDVSDARTTEASASGVCNKNEVVPFQTSSNNHSAVIFVSCSDSDRDTATHNASQPATSQRGEAFSCTPGELRLNSPQCCNEAEFLRESDCEKSSADVRRSSTVQEADLSRRDLRNATKEPSGSVAFGGLNRAQTGEDRLTSKIPATMEADFLEQMHHETCPCASRCYAADFASSEMQLLHILITHVDDDQYFWGQIVNEGIQVTYDMCDFNLF